MVISANEDNSTLFSNLFKNLVILPSQLNYKQMVKKIKIIAPVGARVPRVTFKQSSNNL
jgi:hypothetical protein